MASNKKEKEYRSTFINNNKNNRSMFMYIFVLNFKS